VQVEELRNEGASGEAKGIILGVAEESKVAQTASLKRLNTGYF
jgi:hypothetical protein